MLGRRVRGERTRLGWTQQELAARAHVSVRTVREIERGRATRPGGAAVKLAEALRLDLTDGGLRIGVLGPLVVRVESVQVELRAEKQRSLLALLTLHAGEVVSLDRIVDVLWSDRPPTTWRNLVHTYVTRLRRALSRNAVVGIRGGYQLGDIRCDVADFDAHVVVARRHLDAGDLGAAEQEFRAALGLWRGPVLDDLPDRVRADPAVAPITERRMVAALAHADVALACGRFVDAATSLQLFVHEQPLHEPLHARLIVALAGDGQQAAALELFERIRFRLADDLGIYPGRELRDAHERVLRQDLPAQAGTHRISSGRDAVRPRNIPRLCGSA